MAFIRVEIDEASFQEADKLLARLELEERTNILPKALRAAASPVRREARRTAPDSVKTGSRRKWSKKVRALRQGVVRHKDSIGVSTVRNYQYSGLRAIFVGPLWPIGNLINIIGHPHREVFWGKRTGRTLEGTKYLEKAGERTRPQQQTAFVNMVRRETDKVLARR